MSVIGKRSKQLTRTNLRAVTQSRAFFVVASALVYAVIIVAATMTLNTYFAQTWDVKTFIQAAHRFLDGGNPFDLYAQSRTAQTWPYAYPPLHAFVTAVFLWIGKFVPIAPDYVWARVPALIADIGIGIALYAIVARKSSNESLARLALLLWLFNPVTFYDTAVQGHFESEWIFFILLAYAWLEDSRGIALPTIALAIAVLFKQVAILFAIPLWAFVTLGAFAPLDAHPTSGFVSPTNNKILRSAQNDNLKRLALSLAAFAFMVGVVCLPYLLYSNDFIYMNLTYLENVPVQTQSWIAGLLALTRPAREAMTSDFILLRYQTLVTILAALAISFFAIRRRYSLYLTAALIAIAFFLTSKKVMGYYYVMLFPFLFVEVLPQRRLDLALFAIVLTTWISVSPYYASWVNPDHIWIYVFLGAINSALFVWTFKVIWTRNNVDERAKEEIPVPSNGDQPSLMFVSLGLFVAAVLAAFLQPAAPDGGSPIRMPIAAPAAEASVFAAFGALIVMLLVGMWILAHKIRDVPRAAWALVLIFAPLFFVVYYLTKESTLVLEFVLKTLGV